MKKNPTSVTNVEKLSGRGQVSFSIRDITTTTKWPDEAAASDTGHLTDSTLGKITPAYSDIREFLGAKLETLCLHPFSFFLEVSSGPQSFNSPME